MQRPFLRDNTLTNAHSAIYIRHYGVLFTRTWWRHQMETFSALLALCAGNSPVPVNSPHKGQWRGTLMFCLIYIWINDWVNNRAAGDLRRHRSHYDVTLMKSGKILLVLSTKTIDLSKYFDFVVIDNTGGFTTTKFRTYSVTKIFGVHHPTFLRKYTSCLEVVVVLLSPYFGPAREDEV